MTYVEEAKLEELYGGYDDTVLDFDRDNYRTEAASDNSYSGYTMHFE